ncbi:MAG: hypothetical protein ACT4NL_03950 [Pseudomarimonas sp.]
MTRPSVVVSRFALRAQRWEVPAIAHDAVYAHAELHALNEYVDRVAATLEQGGSADAAVESICLAANARATDLTRQLLGPMGQKQRDLFTDADLIRAMPDRLSKLPRVTWLMGAVAALVDIQAALAVARVACRGTPRSLAEDLLAALRARAAHARTLWDAKVERLLAQHPWIRAEKLRVELVGLETKSPVFVITGCVREAVPGDV